VEKCLIHRPVVVLRELLDLFSRNRFDMLIQLVRANSLDQVLNCTLDFLILGLKFLRLVTDPILLHFDKIVKGECLSILRQVNKDCLGERLKIVLNTVLHDVVDVDNQLLQLGKTLVDVMEITINIH
jgi:hypothetical protein